MNHWGEIAARGFMPVAVLFVTGIFLWLPRWTRPDVYFGVTLPEPFRDSEEGLELLAGYRRLVLVFAAVALGCALTGTIFLTNVLQSVAPFVLGFGALIAFVRTHLKTVPFRVPADTVREAPLTVQRGRLPGGRLAQAGPFILLAVASAALALRWNSLPDRVPVHWGLDGAPVGWLPHTHKVLFSVPLIQGAECFLMLIMAMALLRRGHRISATGRLSTGETGFRRTILRILLVSEYFVAFNGAFPFFLALIDSRQIRRIVLISTIVGTVAVSFLITVWIIIAGVRWSRVRSGRTSKSAPVGDGTPDECWKLGFIYIHRKDPAVFVQRRFGIGYTLNLGNGWSWCLLAGMVLIILVPVLVWT